MATEKGEELELQIDLLVEEAVRNRTSRFYISGTRLFDQGQYDLALHAFGQARERMEKDPRPIFRMAQCFERLGYLSEAKSHYGALLEEPISQELKFQAAYGLANLFYDNWQIEEALGVFEEWNEFRPRPEAQDLIRRCKSL